MSDRKRKGKGKGKGKGKQQAPRKAPQKRSAPRNSGGSTAMAIGGDVGSAVGGYLAPGIGGSLGKAVGTGLGWVFNKITGMGDYKIMSNTLSLPGSPVPAFGENCIRIRHKEYLGDVYGGTAFASQSYDINPGLAQSFPWLSSIAANYQEFMFAGLVYSFVSTSANALNSTNTALGKVLLATDYNPLNPPFISSQAMMATEFSNYGKPADSILHAVECSPKLRPTLWQYVRTGAVPTGADERLYDLGNFQLGSQGMQAVANIGGLWATYDIILCKPVLSPASVAYDSFNYTLISSVAFGLANFGPNVSTRPVGTTFAVVNATTMDLTLPSIVSAGCYRTVIYCSGGLSATAGTQDPYVSFVNAALTTRYALAAYNFATLVTNTNGYWFSIDFTVTAPGASLRIQTPIGATSPGVTASGNLEIRYLGP